MKPVAVLFARTDSNYKKLPGVDVWDAERDARNWRGGSPVIAHPPCRGWGQLRTFARPEPGELQYALDCIDHARRWGGVVEHPQSSLLWKLIAVKPRDKDAFGGWLLPIHQNWWGHKASKSTMLYVVGCEPRDVPPMPMVLGEATHVVQSRKRQDYRPHITRAEREHTPPLLCEWLVELARRCIVIEAAA